MVGTDDGVGRNNDDNDDDEMAINSQQRRIPATATATESEKIARSRHTHWRCACGWRVGVEFGLNFVEIQLDPIASDSLTRSGTRRHTTITIFVSGWPC